MKPSTSTIAPWASRISAGPTAHLRCGVTGARSPPGRQTRSPSPTIHIARAKLPDRDFRVDDFAAIPASGWSGQVVLSDMHPQVISTRGHALFAVDDDPATIHFLPNLGIR